MPIHYVLHLKVFIICLTAKCSNGLTAAHGYFLSGRVYSWGDGDYGKLGRGGSEGSKIPRLIEKLQTIEIENVYCGTHFSVALSKDGQVYTWGKVKFNTICVRSTLSLFYNFRVKVGDWAMEKKIILGLLNLYSP